MAESVSPIRDFVQEEADEREPTLQDRLNWSSAGGAHAATKRIVEFIYEQAGRAFAREDDVGARTLRELGHKLKLWETEARLELDRLHRIAQKKD